MIERAGSFALSLPSFRTVRELPLAHRANQPENPGMKRTPEEVANTIEGFANGGGNQWAWDGFTSIRIDDPELEEVRQKIVNLPVEFPAENPREYCNEAGMQKMREIAQELRARHGGAKAAV